MLDSVQSYQSLMEDLFFLQQTNTGPLLFSFLFGDLTDFCFRHGIGLETLVVRNSCAVDLRSRVQFTSVKLFMVKILAKCTEVKISQLTAQWTILLREVYSRFQNGSHIQH